MLNWKSKRYLRGCKPCLVYISRVPEQTGGMDMKLSDKLILLREESGYTQLDLAERLDVSRQAVSLWETGESKPSSENLIRLSELYNVSMDYLVNDSAQRPAAVAVAEAPEEAPKKGVWRKHTLLGVAIGLALAAVVLLFWMAYRAGYDKGVEDATPTYPVYTDIIDPSDIEGSTDLVGW